MTKSSIRCLKSAIVGACVALFGATAAPLRAQTADAFFDDGALQEVRLTLSRRDWQDLKDTFEEDTYYAADLRWNGITVRNIGIRSRGNITRNGIKPGLKVDINRYLSNQEFLGLKAFVLDNTYLDATLLRERLTMKVFARLGLPSPRECHARVYINGEFAGVYAVVESIDRPFIARVFGTAEAEVETGGHLFEYRWIRPYDFQDLGPGLEAYAELFTPQTRQTDSMISAFGPIRDMVRAINASPDDLFTRAVGNFLDLRSVMRYLAVENFVAETDGFLGEWEMHNFYLYRFRQDPRSELIPWDKDTAFSAPDHPVDFNLETNVLVRRAMAIPELRQVYFDALRECASVAEESASGDSRGWLEREVDREARQIEAAVATDPVFPFSLDQFEWEVESLRRFARTRAAFVRCAVANAEFPSGPQQACSVAGDR